MLKFFGNCALRFICGFVLSLLASPSPYFLALSFCWLVCIPTTLSRENCVYLFSLVVCM